MPRRETERDHRWDLDLLRQGLVDATAGTDLAGDGLSLRVSDLPLFARAADGGLRQAVRVRVRAEHP